MQAYFTLVRRELASYFVSVTGYLIIATVLLLLGFSFTDILDKLNNSPTDAPLTEIFYLTLYFWIILLLTAPIMTMRTFAAERASGTYETLMTAPVNDLQVVLAKFTGALAFYVLTWAPLFGYMLLLHRWVGSPSTALSMGALLGTFIGMTLLGCVFMSLGCLASAMTRSQMVAAMMGYGFSLSMFILSLRSIMPSADPRWSSSFFGFVAMTEHMQEFARGVVDTRRVIYYLSLTVFFLFLNWKVVESRRWK